METVSYNHAIAHPLEPTSGAFFQKIELVNWDGIEPKYYQTPPKFGNLQLAIPPVIPSGYRIIEHESWDIFTRFAYEYMLKAIEEDKETIEAHAILLKKMDDLAAFYEELKGHRITPDWYWDMIYPDLPELATSHNFHEYVEFMDYKARFKEQFQQTKLYQAIAKDPDLEFKITCSKDGYDYVRKAKAASPESDTESFFKHIEVGEIKEVTITFKAPMTFEEFCEYEGTY